jgi:hypothetical protein
MKCALLRRYDLLSKDSFAFFKKADIATFHPVLQKLIERLSNEDAPKFHPLLTTVIFANQCNE